MWFTDKRKKTPHCEKGHDIDEGVAKRVHLKKLPHSNLSSPLLCSPMTLGTPEQDKNLPHCAGPSSMPPWCSLVRDCPRPSQPCTPLRHCPALAAPIYSLGVLQQGAFHRDRAQRDGFCFKKEKKRTRDKCIICSIPVTAVTVSSFEVFFL